MWQLKGKLSPTQSFLIGAVGFLAILAAWHFIASMGLISRSILPEPLKVAQSYGEMTAVQHKTYGDIWDRLLYSIRLNLLGMGEAALISVTIGFFVGLFAPVRSFLGVYIQAARFVPLTALIGVMITWFGIYDNVKVQFLTLGIVVYLIPTVAARVQETLDVHLQTAQTLGATSWQRVITIFFPDVLRRVSTDIISLVAISWTYIVIAEMINNTGGIGAFIWEASRRSRYEQMWAAIILIVVWAFVQDILLRWLDKLVFPDKYRPASTSIAIPNAPVLVGSDALKSDGTLPHEVCENVIELRGVNKVYKGAPPSRFWGIIAEFKEKHGPLTLSCITILMSLCMIKFSPDFGARALSIGYNSFAVALALWSLVRIVLILLGKNVGMSFAQLGFIDKSAKGAPDVTVLKDVDFVVPNKKEGEFAVIMGASGCGKCFTGDTKIKVRNKLTHTEEEVTVEEFIKRFPDPQEPKTTKSGLFTEKSVDGNDDIQAR